MQSSSTSSVAQPEAILDWLQKEMGYRPLGHHAVSNKASMPSSDALRRVCRGNMIPVFNFLLNRVKSAKTVNDIRRNILVHGREDNATGYGSAESRGANRKEKPKGRVKSTNAGDIINRESALQEKESAEKEVERLRRIVRRQRKELKARIMEVSREEADRKRMLDERSNYRHKQVTLEAYNQQCDDAVKIFSLYHHRLSSYVNQANDSHRLEPDSSKPEAIFQNERNISKACEWLAVHMTETLHNSFPAYEGIGIHPDPQHETIKLGINVDENMPDDIQDVIHNCLKSPSQLLLSLITYTQKLKSLISREIENIDIRADAETLRYKYENNIVTDASPDATSPLQLQLYGNGNIASKGTQNQFHERQKAHLQKFVATEDQLNKAAEAKKVFQKLLKRLYGSSDEDDDYLQNMSSLRQLELEVWAMEREAAGLKASLTTLMSEVHRLNILCEDRKEAEDSLNKKWKKIEEFDGRRSELKFISDSLMKANMEAVNFWSQQPLTSREHSSKTIIPQCAVVINITHNTKDLIEKESSVFSRVPDNTLYMLPSTPQSLMESMIPIPSSGAVAERNAALLTAKAASGNPSAIPSISRISSALLYPSGFEGSDASLASVLESMEFCLKLRGSEACLLEDLSNAINMIHTRRELVESGHALLNHAYRTQKEYQTSIKYCLDEASEQDDVVSESWMPELKKGVSDAQKSLEDCKYVSGLLDEWWEQPGSTVVDWVTVDGENVAAWHNHVKQLLTYYDHGLLVMILGRMWSWVSLNIVLTICLTLKGYVSEANPSALVGIVYCDTCFNRDFSKSSHFISGASVVVECGGKGVGESGMESGFREEVKTNSKGEFTVKLPFAVTERIRECSVKLLRSNQPNCPLVATSAQSPITLKTKTPGSRVFSAGVFTFRPRKQPRQCQTGMESTTEFDDSAGTNAFGLPLPYQFQQPSPVPRFPFQPPSPVTIPMFPFQQPPPDSMFVPDSQPPPDSMFTPSFQPPSDSFFTPNFQPPPGDSMFDPVPLQPPPDSMYDQFLTPPPPSPSFFPSFPFPPIQPLPNLIQSPPPPSMLATLPPPELLPPFPPFPFQPSQGMPGTPPGMSSVHLKKTLSP
ncbi:hypothetical protein LXL04_013422 [Taraxacum kok-saghyz]